MYKKSSKTDSGPFSAKILRTSVSRRVDKKIIMACIASKAVVKANTLVNGPRYLKMNPGRKLGKSFGSIKASELSSLLFHMFIPADSLIGQFVKVMGRGEPLHYRIGLRFR